MATAMGTDLRSGVRGETILDGDAGYDEARAVYNAMIDRRPHAVVRPADVDDVVTAVGYAHKNSLPVAVRGGGHSVPGFGTATTPWSSTCRRCARSRSTRSARSRAP